jgi:uncharacterized protein YndB with AHSA1/START domain
VSDLGEITSCWTITFRRKAKQPPARVWAAVTDPDQIARWWRHPAHVDLRVGGAYRVDFGAGGCLDGVIVRVQPERHLAYVWGVSVVEWTFEPDDEGCRYTFMHHGQPPAPEGADYTDEGIAAGYRIGLDTFAALLDGAPAPAAPPLASWERFTGLYRPLIEDVLKRRPGYQAHD